MHEDLNHWLATVVMGWIVYDPDKEELQPHFKGLHYSNYSLCPPTHKIQLAVTDFDPLNNFEQAMGCLSRFNSIRIAGGNLVTPGNYFTGWTVSIRLSDRHPWVTGKGMPTLEAAISNAAAKATGYQE